MTMRYVHDLECYQCKIRDEFYKRFDSSSEKDAPCFGIISYIKFVMSVSSDKSEREFPKNDSFWYSKICYLKLTHQRTVREQILEHLKPKTKNSHPQLVTFHSRKAAKNLLTLKKSESFSSESSQDITIGSNNVGTCNNVDVYKCKYSKKSPVVKKVKTGSKEPRIGTLKRKRWNLEKRKTNKSCDRSSKEPRIGTLKRKRQNVGKLKSKKLHNKNSEESRIGTLKYKRRNPEKLKSCDQSSKEPRIGTLKRKRWNLEKLKSEKSYEDDLFEEQKVKCIEKIPEDSDSSEKITTPKWSVQVSPRDLSPSPSYRDCYSPNELQNNRKSAEEYRYRRNKRKNVQICKEPEETADLMKREDPDTYRTLEQACDKLVKLVKIKKVECDSDEDHYFTDNAEDTE